MKFSCPSCDGHIEAGPEWAGEPTTCPHCNASIEVPAEAAFPPSGPPPEYPGEVSLPAGRTSGLAIASLICGILGFFTIGVTSLPAIITGHIARGSIKRDSSLVGGGMALAGLIMGYMVIAALFAITVLAVLASISVPVYNSITERARITKQITQMTMIQSNLRTYAIDNDGRYPESLAELVPDYLNDDGILNYTRLDGEGFDELVYFEGHGESDPAETIILAAPEVVQRGKRLVSFNDGSTRLIPEAEYQQRTSGGAPK